MKNNKVTAIILAGGMGSRMMSDKTKQNIVIRGKTVLERTLSAFMDSKLVTDVILVARREEISVASSVAEMFTEKPISVVEGGATRAHSAKNGFSALKQDADFVAIHDSARCMITSEMIDKVISSAFCNGAATAACCVTDTIKVVDEKGIIIDTLPRERIYRAQTPQVFAVGIYKNAIESYKEDLSLVTDDNMLVETLGVNITCVDLGADNIKITTSDDLLLAEFILDKRGE